MESVKLKHIRKVICLGIGGGDLFYVAKFLFTLGKTVIGYDISESLRTKDLESLGIKISYKNPQGKLPNSNLVIYSDSLSDSLLNKIKNLNNDITFCEVGEYKRNLLNSFQNRELTEDEERVLLETNMFPLFNIDLEGIRLIGVTGTDGKTTVVSMLYHILLKLGYNPGMISTIGMRIGHSKQDIGLHVTTPSSHTIFKSLLLLKKKKCTHVIIECTSQGLYMGRLAGLKFDTVVYTNIKREHLGYHKSWNRYADAKSLLIRENLRKEGVVVLNLDDVKGVRYLERFAKNKLYYSIKNRKLTEGLLLAKDVKESSEGISFNLSELDVNIPILGKYNISNALAAISTLKSLGIVETKSAPLLKDFVPVEGRMNILKSEPFKVIVDFAHTPNGLLNALKSIRKITTPGKNVILVFGCAAKRDEYKRPVMGSYAKRYANITILTAEDCRSESLKEINNQIAEGWKSTNIKKNRELIRFDNDKINVVVRRDAIKKALSLAHPGDTVLITGKGHEKSLCFGLKEYEWNEIKEVENLISVV